MLAFVRSWSLIIDRYRIIPVEGSHNLSIEFNVEKDTTRTPNKAKIRVINFGRNIARSLPNKPEVQLIAGYKDWSSTIFSGQADRVYYHQDTTEAFLDIEAKDSGSSYRAATLSRSFGSNTAVLDVLKYALDQMGVGYGNLDTVSSQITTRQGLTTFAQGYAANGAARELVQSIITSSGFRWSIQDGAINIRSGNEPINKQAVKLITGGGLIGSPSKDARGKVSARAHLLPFIYPGRIVVLESLDVEGNFSVSKCKYTGKSYTTDWYVDIVLREY